MERCVGEVSGGPRKWECAESYKAPSDPVAPSYCTRLLLLSLSDVGTWDRGGPGMRIGRLPNSNVV